MKVEFGARNGLKTNQVMSVANTTAMSAVVILSSMGGGLIVVPAW